MLDFALPALLLVVIGMAWHTALAAREAARFHARALCRRARLQLLDETVALERLRPRRDQHGRWCIERRYRFEVSREGHERLPADLHMVGTQLVGYRLPPEDHDEAPPRGVVVRFPPQP